MTDTPQGRSEINEATGEIRTKIESETQGGFVPLGDCEPGPFETRHGTLGFKSEYRTAAGAVEAYCFDSGEFFWGGASNPAAQIMVPVRSVEIARLVPPPVSGGASTCDRPGQADAAVAEAAQALLRQLKFVHSHPSYEGVWTLAHLHGVRYQGPKYDAELSALEAALRAAVPMELEGWRPIETAPKDGTQVLCLTRLRSGPEYNIGYFNKDEWFAYNDGADIHPSLWRPLPAPPTAAPSKETGEGEEDETYAIGHRDGYEAAVAAIDCLTGGDGEFVFSTLPGEGCADAPAMMVRIAERFEARALASREPTRLEGGVTQEQVEAALTAFNGCWKCERHEWMRAALEAAASAAPSDAGGKEGQS